MPKLNPEILTDVLIECLKKENDSQTLGKFMVSGQQPFQCAINYFKKAIFVELRESSLIVTIKTGRVTHKHEISYQFLMINLIMKILATSIEEFSISPLPPNFEVVEYFLEHKIKKVDVNQNLPQKYRELMASCDFIEKITYFAYFVWDEIGPIDMIPPSCRELTFKFTHFHGVCMNRIMKNSEGDVESFKNIEKLEIDAQTLFSCYFPKRYIAPFILNYFPNLQTVNMIAIYDDKIKYVIDMFKDKDMKYFQRFAKSNITGKLILKNRITTSSRYKSVPTFEKVLQDVHDIPGVISDAENQTITRIVELKENLIVEFMLSFKFDYDCYKNR